MIILSQQVTLLQTHIDHISLIQLQHRVVILIILHYNNITI